MMIVVVTAFTLRSRPEPESSLSPHFSATPSGSTQRVCTLGCAFRDWTTREADRAPTKKRRAPGTVCRVQHGRGIGRGSSAEEGQGRRRDGSARCQDLDPLRLCRYTPNRDDDQAGAHVPQTGPSAASDLYLLSCASLVRHPEQTSRLVAVENQSVTLQHAPYPCPS